MHSQRVLLQMPPATIDCEEWCILAGRSYSGIYQQLRVHKFKRVGLEAELVWDAQILTGTISTNLVQQGLTSGNQRCTSLRGRSMTIPIACEITERLIDICGHHQALAIE